MYLFDDRPDLTFLDPVIIIATAMALGALGFGLLSRYRLRRRPRRGAAYQVFREDAARSLIAWGAAQLALGLGWALRVEGLRMPVWSYVGLLAGAVIAVLLWRRERGRWPALAKTEGIEQLPDGRVERGTSQTWEMGYLMAGAVGLVAYLSTAGHTYGHPIHWLTTGLLLPPAYALGMAIWSPRFKLTVVRAPRSTTTTAKRRRSAKPKRDDPKRAA